MTDIDSSTVTLGINSDTAQPLHVAQIEAALLTLRTATAVSGMSVSTLYRQAAAGRLKMVKVGTRCTRIRAADLRAFMAALG